MGAALTGDISKHKIDEILKEILNVFGTAVDILILHYDAESKDHERILKWIIWICHKVNLKLNKDKGHFRYMRAPLMS